MNENVKEKFRVLLLELVSIPDDEREMEILEILDKISPDPEYLDYVFQSDEFYDEYEGLNIDGVVEKVFNYKPIEL